MKWTYLCKWLLAILVVVGLFYLQANFIPKEILPFVGMFLIVVMLKILQAYEK